MLKFALPSKQLASHSHLFTVTLEFLFTSLWVHGCNCDTCPYYPEVRQAVNKCFKRWGICTRRANAAQYTKVRFLKNEWLIYSSNFQVIQAYANKERTPERYRFKCYEHPCDLRRPSWVFVYNKPKHYQILRYLDRLNCWFYKKLLERRKEPSLHHNVQPHAHFRITLPHGLTRAA